MFRFAQQWTTGELDGRLKIWASEFVVDDKQPPVSSVASVSFQVEVESTDRRVVDCLAHIEHDIFVRGDKVEIGREPASGSEATFSQAGAAFKHKITRVKKARPRNQRQKMILSDVEQSGTVGVGPTGVSPYECFRELRHYALPN